MSNNEVHWRIRAFSSTERKLNHSPIQGIIVTKSSISNNKKILTFFRVLLVTFAEKVAALTVLKLTKSQRSKEAHFHE